MKFKILSIIFILFMLGGTIAVAERSYSTFELTADTQILTKGGTLAALVVVTDGTNDARVILYDVSAAADVAVTNKIIEITVTGADNYGGRSWPFPVQFTEGLYADVNGTGASYFVEWLK